MYHLENEDIYLPLNPPTEKGYKFKNWKKIISSSPGDSNVIRDVTCLPNAKNTFIPLSIESKGCSGKKNIFLIFGKWNDPYEKNIPTLLSFLLVLEYENYTVASCDYETKEPIHMKCEFEGDGNYQIREQYFNGILASYKIGKEDSPIIFEKCSSETSDDDDDNNFYLSLSSFFLFFNKILIILIILLI